MDGKEPNSPALRPCGIALAKWRPSAWDEERGVDEEDEAFLESLRRSLRDLEEPCGVPIPRDAGTWDVDVVGPAASRFELEWKPPKPRDEAREVGVRCIVSMAVYGEDDG